MSLIHSFDTSDYLTITSWFFFVIGFSPPQNLKKLVSTYTDRERASGNPNSRKLTEYLKLIIHLSAVNLILFSSFHLHSFCFVKWLFARLGISGPEIQCSLRQGHKLVARKFAKQKSRYTGNRNKRGEKTSPRSYSVGSLCNSF